MQRSGYKVKRALAVALVWTLFVVMTDGSLAQAQEEPKTEEQVIEPELDRREIKIPRIDTENFEVGVFTGVLSVEDFGTESVSGVRLAYHITEDFFVEAEFGESTVSDSSFRRLGAPIFPEEEEDLEYYSVSFGWNFLPGEVFFGKKRAFTSSVYLIGGVGNTDFIDEDRTTVNIGIGLRFLPTDFLGLHVTLRDYIWDSDLLGRNKSTDNFEATFSLTFFF